MSYVDIYRSFPGFFAKRKGKHRFSPIQNTQKKKVNIKAFTVYVYLLNSTRTPSTPSAAEELELSQAGLGKRSLDLTDDMDHAMVL